MTKQEKVTEWRDDVRQWLSDVELAGARFKYPWMYGCLRRGADLVTRAAMLGVSPLPKELVFAYQDLAERKDLWERQQMAERGAV
jgi:hypothetical protein